MRPRIWPWGATNRRCGGRAPAAAGGSASKAARRAGRHVGLDLGTTGSEARGGRGGELRLHGVAAARAIGRVQHAVLRVVGEGDRVAAGAVRPRVREDAGVVVGRRCGEVAVASRVDHAARVALQRRDPQILDHGERRRMPWIRNEDMRVLPRPARRGDAAADNRPINLHLDAVLTDVDLHVMTLAG